MHGTMKIKFISTINSNTGCSGDVPLEGGIHNG